MTDTTDLFDARALTGDGKMEMAIFEEKGRTIQRFKSPVLWVAYDPSNAVAIGWALIDSATKCGAQVTVQVPRRRITKQQRDQMIVRSTHVFRSMSERGKPPAEIVRSVVDSILAMVE